MSLDREVERLSVGGRLDLRMREPRTRVDPATYNPTTRLGGCLAACRGDRGRSSAPQAEWSGERNSRLRRRRGDGSLAAAGRHGDRGRRWGRAPGHVPPTCGREQHARDEERDGSVR